MNLGDDRLRHFAVYLDVGAGIPQVARSGKMSKIHPGQRAQVLRQPSQILEPILAAKRDVQAPGISLILVDRRGNIGLGVRRF